MKIAAIIACGAAASLALGHGEDADYGLAIIDGITSVGLGDHDTGTITEFGERVFGADMSVSGPNWFADEPGIFIAENSLPDNTQVSFTLTSALLFWDGAGAVDFVQSANAMNLTFGPASVSTAFDNNPVAGFSINYDADQAGGFDEHFDYTIDASAPAGIYVLANSFSLSGAADSDVIFTVFNAGLGEDLHEEAIEYVEHVLVPAPGATGVLAIAGLGVMSRRRRS
ncbi:MAG: hypothetical protein NXI07_12060 [bacterium]|nr:hypothetical protein [bacterium]